MKFCIFTDLHLNAYKTKKQEFFDFLVKMDAEVDAFICAGDWCSLTVDELEVLLILCRKATKKPILSTLGNHDLWDNSPIKKYSLDEILELHETLFKKYNIVYLEKEVFETPTSLIIGFMGWYGVNNPGNTVDYDYIPIHNSLGIPAYHFLKKRELDGLYRVIDYKTEKQKVCVTHFSFTTNISFEQLNAHERHRDILADNCKIVILGHSHEKVIYEKNGCKFYNAGASYTKPDFEYHCIILEL